MLWFLMSVVAFDNGIRLSGKGSIPLNPRAKMRLLYLHHYLMPKYVSSNACYRHYHSFLRGTNMNGTTQPIARSSFRYCARLRNDASGV